MGLFEIKGFSYSVRVTDRRRGRSKSFSFRPLAGDSPGAVARELRAVLARSRRAVTDIRDRGPSRSG